MWTSQTDMFNKHIVNQTANQLETDAETTLGNRKYP